MYPYFIEFCDKVEYSKAVVKSYLGIALGNEFRAHTNSDYVIRHCVMPDRNGVFQDIRIDSSLKDKIIYRLDLIQKGTQIENFLNTQIAIIFIKLDAKDEHILKNINTLIYPICNVFNPKEASNES